MAAVFDAFFGFVYWGVAWLLMRRADVRSGRLRRSVWWDWVHVICNVVIILIGLGVYLGAGTAATVMHIMKRLENDKVRQVFSCESNVL